VCIRDTTMKDENNWINWLLKNDVVVDELMKIRLNIFVVFVRLVSVSLVWNDEVLIIYPSGQK